MHVCMFDIESTLNFVPLHNTWYTNYKLQRKSQNYQLTVT